MPHHPFNKQMKRFKLEVSHKLQDAGCGVKKQAIAGSEKLEILIKELPKKSIGIALLTGAALTLLMRL
jgi:hypothetical protein